MRSISDRALNAADKPTLPPEGVGPGIPGAARKGRLVERSSDGSGPGRPARPWASVLASLLLAGVIGCGSDALDASGDSVPPPPPPEKPSTPPPTDGCEEFDGTFAAIEDVIFTKRRCNDDVCHGSARAGGLDLRPGRAHQNLFEVPAVGSSAQLIVPGDRERSYLYAKLAAATLPGTVEINGAPMPSGFAPLSEEELTAIRLWIGAGAPAEGTVPDTEELLDACLPPSRPISIEPLSPPKPDEGVQFVMPPVDLPAASEQELCFATYYDFTGQIPERFLDPSGRFFRIDTQEARQDPMSHHLVLSHSGVPVEDIDDPAFPPWTCAGGADAGESCDPLTPDSCGEGVCRTEPVDSFACIGFGPASVIGLPTASRNIGGGQEPQIFQELRSGVFGQVPLKGIAFWNTHAFNLTTEDHLLNGRLNLYFAEEQEFAVLALIAGGATFSPDAAPYTIDTTCASHTMPEGARLFSITSHNHKRGIHFWATLADETLLYENFVYNDPTRLTLDPPLAFDSPDRDDRRITYCATFNNGVAADGSPDPETVTRLSRIPAKGKGGTLGASCSPIACVEGQVAAACTDDRDCDSEPGSNDGWCDACPITGGETTENEMFILLGQYYMAEGFPQPSTDDFIGVGF